MPRDRNGSFEPKIIGKYDRNADGMEDKILALYACGMSQRDIAEQIKELYGVEISPELVTKISEKIMPEVTAWQNRPLEPVYPFVFMDAIHYKVREDRRYVTKAAYVVLGVTMDGRKDILGVWIGEHENSKFWLNVLNDLKSRGVLDVYLFCTDGLCGMIQAIEAVFPKSRLQRCIVHQVRSSTRYVSYKDIKKVVADLKKIYSAVTLEEAEKNLQAFAETWRKQYPSCVKSWEENWPVLSTFFEYPVEIRKIIYTTNIIEGLNRQFRQITKNKPSFTNDDSLRRMLYLASQRIVKHWHARYGHIRTGHHKRNSERILEIADFSLFGVSAPLWSAEVAPNHKQNYGGFFNMNVRNEIKAQIIRAGMTMQEVVDLLSDEYGWSDSVSNLSAKLQRESIRYKEVLELAAVLGYDIVWQKRREK